MFASRSYQANHFNDPLSAGNHVPCGREAKIDSEQIESDLNQLCTAGPLEDLSMLLEKAKDSIDAKVPSKH